MRNAVTKARLICALLADTVAFGGVTTATAGVTSCAASGGKQEGGAVVGAAAGSAIGCEAQKDKAKRQAYAPATYMRNGYRLSSAIQPAGYSRIGQTFVSVAGVNLRAAPNTNAPRVGRLHNGERFQALAAVRGTEWVLVGRNGVGVGYVRADFVRPANGQRYAAY